MRVLELGSYVAPAYAGMILAEQGHDVEKWTVADPIHSLNHGDELWAWINHGKTITNRHSSTVSDLTPGAFDVIIDNHRAEAWRRWGVDPAIESERLSVVWASLRADNDGRSFDVIAQARAWGDKMMAPFYLGDTAAGLWLAFKALAAPTGHHVIRQAACLAKLVEGELVAPYSGLWDEPGTYGHADGVAKVVFRGEVVQEPMRDNEWRRASLPSRDGRLTI